MFVFNIVFPKESSNDYFFAKNFKDVSIEENSFKYTIFKQPPPEGGGFLLNN